ncbi:hypothetical protein [Nocardia sp. NPDC048505]|uniref:hypothetical protein n=1 Tax=unclassified Nocardia TaxID=2637762 RepID=UPI0033CEC1B4
MAKRDYSAAIIKVLPAGESVRSRPGMYFGVGRDDPELPTRVLGAVLGDLLHPPPRSSLRPPIRVRADITADLAFSIGNDQLDPLDDRNLPVPGYFGMIGPNAWAPAAVAALCRHAVAEIWRDGHGFRQQLGGLPPEPPFERIESKRPGSGFHITYELDPAYFRADASLPTAPDTLRLHGPGCPERCAPGEVTLHDHRGGAAHRLR